MFATITEFQPRAKVAAKEYTQDELRAAFDRVACTKNWKNRINRIVTIADAAERDLISKAIIHFTGSVPEFVEQPSGKVRVIADGYYAAIGA